MSTIQPFRKVQASENHFKHVRERFSEELQRFKNYAAFLTIQAGQSKGNSGKPSSYERYLAKCVVLYEEIFQQSFPPLQTREALHAFNQLRALPNYHAFNQSEFRFPNAAINCFESFSVHTDTLSEHFIDQAIDDYGTVPLLSSVYEAEPIQTAGQRLEKVKFAGQYVYPRNVRESLRAKELNNWSCEIDTNHKTFIDQHQRPYVEGHHLVPMATQDDFDYTVDFAANITCLCPTCHRQIHYAIPDQKSPLIEILYEKRHHIYADFGISISKDRLMQYYGVLSSY